MYNYPEVDVMQSLLKVNYFVLGYGFLQEELENYKSHMPSSLNGAVKIELSLFDKY